MEPSLLPLFKGRASIFLSR